MKKIANELLAVLGTFKLIIRSFLEQVNILFAQCNEFMTFVLVRVNMQYFRCVAIKIANCDLDAIAKLMEGTKVQNPGEYRTYM